MSKPHWSSIWASSETDQHFLGDPSTTQTFDNPAVWHGVGLLRLPSGEDTMIADVFEVPTDLVCLVHAVVLRRVPFYVRPSA
jgi:hypothetical protein